jgi:hypothetical protein
MTPADFRKLALAFPGTSEGSHMGHADFRVGGKIFATLGYPNDLHGTIMLSPLDQDLLLQRHAKAFKPAAGAWGKAGSTSVILKAAPKRVVALALESAWTRRASKQAKVAKRSR